MERDAVTSHVGPGSSQVVNMSSLSMLDLTYHLMLLTHNGSHFYNNSGDVNASACVRDPLELAKWMGPPLLVICGTVGNLLAAAVLLRRRFRAISTTVFLLALAASDTVYLYSSNFTLIWLSQYLNLSPRLHADWSCRLTVYTLRSAADVSSWLVVAVTMERLLAVCAPFRAKGLCSRPRALLVVCMVVVMILLVNVFTFFTYKVHSLYNMQQHRICYIDENLGPLVMLLIVLYDDMCYSFIPACIICVSNAAILVRMIRQGQRMRRGQGDSGCGGFSTEARHLTMMLVTVSFVFLASTLPICTMSSYYALLRFYNRPLQLDRPLTTLLLRVLMNSNHALNFLLYCLSGPPFRQELCRMSHETVAAIRSAVHTTVQAKDRVVQLDRPDQNGDSIPMIERTQATVATEEVPRRGSRISPAT